MSAIPVARQKLIADIAACTRGMRRTPIPAAAFIKEYFHGVDEDDLRASPASELAAAAIAHLRFASRRPRGRALVRVYNPSVERDGYASTHTIVETTLEDMPFLVDSLSMVMTRAGLRIHRMMHPVLPMKRDRRGDLLELLPDAADNQRGVIHESWQRFEVDRLEDESAQQALERQILAVLEDVRLAVADWQPMREAALKLASELDDSSAPSSAAERREVQAFLHWLADDNFTFLGYREYRLERGRSFDVAKPLPDTGLGILRPRRNRAAKPKTLTGAMREHARDPQLLTITKANSFATVHRATHLDYIGIKTFDKSGRVIGEKRFLGLFTSAVYRRSPRDIPLLREKVERVVAHFGLDPASHDAKAIVHVLDTYPRDELFQANVADLIRIVRAVVNLYERQRVRVLLRRDVFGRFYSALIYVPRDRYTTQVRQKMEAVIKQALHATAIESQVQISESALARVHMIIRLPSALKERIDIDALEARIADAVTTWEDRLREALVTKLGEADGLELANRLTGAFPASYQEDTSTAIALDDIEHLRVVVEDRDRMMLRLVPGDGQTLHLRLLRSASPIALSRALPILENMGFTVVSERPYKLSVPGSPAVWLQNFEMQRRDGVRIDFADLGPRFNDAFLAVWTGRAENDGFNRLVVLAGLTWREAMMLRAYCRYILQTSSTFSQAYMEQVLASNPQLARLLWDIFRTQFDPAYDPRRREADLTKLREQFAKRLDAVKSLDEDRILRRFSNVIAATLRTNYFQPETQTPGTTTFKSYVSFKLNPRAIDELPLPKPAFEIFVYSPRVEGVHLRMGHVARGGIRWSDRREDFRTEVLGLMKAQTVKNTLIVPVGAKGGFVPKQLPTGGNREDIQREGVECYRTFIRGLLDVTDNIVGGRVVPPTHVVRRDGDDAYLVVAADKGTATFSDIANRISAEYNFWLGDAFASGGSAGYDHKKMGITARGAWECVKRHFREIGIDTQTQDFTVVGIGDMSGDVFGNGMLRSKHIKLVAAFNHQHIFIDPDPDPARSYEERARLFALPRSTWDDYDRKVLSKGGGIYPRSAKTIRISREAQQAFGLPRDTFAPNELIRAILCLPVDLLWNGGIGTYVKASDETNAEVGDRANDAVRVNGKDLRAKIVGEGGNLGFSQRGRIEYALHGGRLNTDFIDNSAGVDCSDHEVNIKIMLRSLPARAALSLAERNRLLAQMTEDVAEHVLRDNYLQSQAISMLEARAEQDLPEHAHTIRSLELTGHLDRALEFLPSVEEIAERHRNRRGLTRPELAVLLAYSKMALFQRLIDSDVPEDPYLSNELQRYFPPVIQRRFGRHLDKHPLRREIIATATTNSLVNRMGPSFARRVQEDTGADAATVVRAYAIARESFDMRRTWSQIEALDNAIEAKLQYEMMYETTRLLSFVTYWLIHRHRGALHIEQQVHRLRGGLAELDDALPSALSGADRKDFEQRRERMLAASAPAALAKRIALLPALRSGPDLVEIAQATNLDVAAAARVYFGLSTSLSLDWLRSRIEQLTVEGHWQAVARATLRDTIYGLQRALALQVLRSKGRAKPQQALESWLEKQRTEIAALRQSINEMRTLPQTDFATLSVALQAVRKIAERG
jgi:glutamate dehydrogenase